MEVHIWIVGLLIAFSAISQSQKTDVLRSFADYAVAVIKNLSASHVGKFDCWFHTIEVKPTGDSLIDFILPELDEISKVVFTGNCSTPILVQPALWIIHVKEFPSPFALMALFRNIFYAKVHNLVRIVVFFKPPSEYFLRMLYSLFIYTALFNVVYVEIEPFRTFYYLKYPQRWVFENELLSANRMFVDQTADLGRSTFLISYRIGSNNINQQNIVLSPAWQWITTMFDALNGTYRFDGIDCDFTTNFKGDECRERIQRSVKNEPYDLSLETIYQDTVNSQSVLRVSSITQRLLVVVPRGRKLATIELFAEPFNLSVWVALLILLGSCLLIMWLYPSLFKNDLILLPLCGYEQSDMNRAHFLEKTIISVLTIFYFFLLSAYETKIIALMASYPRMPDSHTIDDMIQSGIRLRLDLNLTEPTIQEGNELLKVIDDEPGFSYRKNITFDGIHAYFGAENALRMMMAHPSNYDFEAERSKYVELTGFQYGIVIHFALVRFRSALMKRYDFTERHCAEAGLLQHWDEQWLLKTMGVNYGTRIADSGEDKNKVLYLAELKPAWIVLIVGWSISTLVCVLENVKTIDRHKLKQYIGKRLGVPEIDPRRRRYFR